MTRVLDDVPGQEPAMAFLRQAASRPHHAYLLAGPEGCGKSLAGRAFAAALLCPQGGCGECRSCRLALGERHPNLFLVEPEGRDIHVDTVRDEVWHPAHRTAPEPGRKVFVIREADRLNPAAADVLLKVLEEPPADAVLLLLSARPHELPETVLSRCHVVTFTPLAEGFVVDTLVGEGVPEPRARLAARLAGGNLGRARRLAVAADGLAFRDVAERALELAAAGPAGALAAAEEVVAAAERYRKGLKDELAAELEPFLDERGRPDEASRGTIKRLEARHHRRLRRAERDQVDQILLAASAALRDRVLAAAGGRPDWRVSLDREADPAPGAVPSARGWGAIERARAALADETNLNLRLVLEEAFLELAGEGAAAR
ncbi:MAG: DNA polymerase III subunit [Actinobacteria bacterium]|nr:DNA polymerase III subunit [Actinomycetota bacterium]